MNIREEKYSFENSRRIMQREDEIKRLIDAFINDYDCNRKALTSHINKSLYEFAEKHGMSLYDICFHTKPEIREKVSYTNGEPLKLVRDIEYEVELVPVYLELEKGPGYWKSKYYELKERMQALIDGDINKKQ